jgi:hypothetical protein
MRASSPISIRALRAVGRADLRGELRRHLDAEDAEGRVAAAWSAARLRDQGAVAVLAAEAERGGRLGARRYSPRTEEAYCAWIRRFILFHGRRQQASLRSARRPAAHPQGVGQLRVV